MRTFTLDDLVKANKPSLSVAISRDNPVKRKDLRLRPRNGRVIGLLKSSNLGAFSGLRWWQQTEHHLHLGLRPQRHQFHRTAFPGRRPYVTHRGITSTAGKSKNRSVLIIIFTLANWKRQLCRSSYATPPSSLRRVSRRRQALAPRVRQTCPPWKVTSSSSWSIVVHKLIAEPCARFIQ